MKIVKLVKKIIGGRTKDSHKNCCGVDIQEINAIELKNNEDLKENACCETNKKDNSK